MEVFNPFIMHFIYIWILVTICFNCLGDNYKSFFSETATVFYELKNFIHPSVCMSVSRSWLNFHFWVDCPFKVVKDKITEGPDGKESKLTRMKWGEQARLENGCRQTDNKDQRVNAFGREKDQMKLISNQIGKHTEKKGIKICQRRETTKKRQKNRKWLK